MIKITPFLRLESISGADRRTDNLPIADEVAAIILKQTGNVVKNRDIRIIYEQPIHTSPVQRNLNVIRYTCLSVIFFYFPWVIWGGFTNSKPEIPITESVKENTISVDCTRGTMHFPTLLAGRLFQHYVADAWIMVQQSILSRLRNHQKEIRADLYIGLQDAITEGDTDFSSLGRCFILPSSFLGGLRFMAKQFQDAMAIVRRYGKPSLFITFTANPQ